MKTFSPAFLPMVPGHVRVPSYLDAEQTIGIAHIGVGNFHRSHQAMYVDRLLDAHPDAPWAICGIGVREEDRTLAAAMRAQGGLYSLSLFGPDGSIDTAVIGAIREFLLVPDDPARVLTRLLDPSIRIVSLTITESGYVEDPANGRTAATDTDIRADVDSELAAPRTAFGLLVAALRARRELGIPAFTVMSCDNIQNNGAVARASTVATARLLDDDVAMWIDENVAFPSTMVDRITPRATPDQLARVETTLGVHDAAAVVAEPFEQWVLEDDFPAGRPDWESVGAVFVDDINAYESMKLRLLNGAHQVMAYSGLLLGHTFAHEAIADSRVRGVLHRYWYDLALPSVSLPPGVDGDGYIATLSERFSNPAVADTLERLATDSSDRMAKFVLPVLLDARTTTALSDVGALIVASWATAVAASSSGVIRSSTSPQDLEVLATLGAQTRLLSEVEWLSPLADVPHLAAATAAAVSALNENPAAAFEDICGPGPV